MKKIFSILRREYLTRVKKKSFLITTLLGPVFLMATMAIPNLLLLTTPDEQQHFAVVDQHGEILDRMRESLDDDLLGDGRPRYVLEKVEVSAEGLEETRQELNQRVLDEKILAYLIIGEDLEDERSFTYYARNTSDIMEMDKLESILYRVVMDLRLETSESDLDRDELDRITRRISLKVVKVEKSGEETESSEEARVIGFISNYIMILFFYMTFLLWGVAIARGVIEEKSSRIVEVLLSSVSPFQLMLGKVVGIGLVGLTQVAIYAVSGAAVLGYGKSMAGAAPYLSSVSPMMFVYFFVFFLLGYFLYATLFAAVGAVCNTDQELQQAQMPVIILLIIPLLTIFYFIRHPDSTLSVIMSFIPLYTPFFMFVRVNTIAPPFWQVGVSMILTTATIFLFVWLVAKVFRVGILMYGKRPGIREIFRWLRKA